MSSLSKIFQTSPTFEIYYVLALPDWEPEEITPFQGFAPGLLPFVPLMEWILTLPPDIHDPLLNMDDRLSRRRAGAGPWLWSPINLSTLISKRKPTPYQPFMVVFTADADTAKAVSNWRSTLRIKPVHISFYKGGGAIHPADFTQENLKNHLMGLARKAKEVYKGLDIQEHLKNLSEWTSHPRKPSNLKYHSHGVTKPNEMVLIAAGGEPPASENGQLESSPHEHYLQGITDSVRAVMALWEHTKGRPGYLINPPRPDLFLLAPAAYRGISKRLLSGVDNFIIKNALRSLDRQRGYTIGMRFMDGDEGTTENQINLIGPVLGLRGAEMKLTTAAVGLRTAGTVAATLRLPPEVNRTGGVIGQLARFLRTHENPPPVKAARVFKVVQDALLSCIPPDHLKLIANSEAGIKIIADAPLEWLPVDGLPLGIRFDVSRINSTPGNLFMGQIRPPIPIYISPAKFKEYLVLSMYDEGDPIAPHLRLGALSARDGNGDPILGKFASPKTADEFCRYINSFKGPMLIVDGHAVHEDGDVPGGLMINGALFDIWELVDKISMPPIVILSACDTHPFDRNHATVANGFLACGAIAVVATALPIRAPDAARFIMRLINRAVHYGDLINKMGIAVSWTHMVSGLLRMELSTDIIRHFHEKGYYDEDVVSDLMLKTNNEITPFKPDWYENMLKNVFAACRSEPDDFDRVVSDVIASSDAIRYLHLGNPETIMVADHRPADRATEEAGLRDR